MSSTSVKVSEDCVRTESKNLFRIPYEIGTVHFVQSFSTHFGTKPSVVKLVYNELVITGTKPNGYCLQYLLWALYFLRSNETDLKLSATFGCAVMSVRKWVWVSIRLLCNIKVVSFFSIFLY